MRRLAIGAAVMAKLSLLSSIFLNCSQIIGHITIIINILSLAQFLVGRTNHHM
jgi:hypothetical protein